MAKHFPAGVNGTNGIESLQGIIDDEELNSEIEKAANEDSDACMRPIIMDYISQKDPTLVSKIETGDMKQEVEAITFEDIKPYVSMYKGKDGKIVHDILDKDGKSVTTFNNAKDAIDFLSKNFDKLKKGDAEIQKRKQEIGMQKEDDGKPIMRDPLDSEQAKDMQRDSDYLYLRGKEIDQDSIVYKMEDYSDLIFELQSANYADGTELDEKELEELEGTEELIDWVRIDYVSESAEMGGVNENPETDYEGSMDYELSGDDGEVAHGTIHYKAINGVVDPKSLEGSYEYDGNHKVTMSTPIK